MSSARTHDSHKSLFLDISVWLTGFEEVELQGTGMLDECFETICKESTPGTLNLFFAEVVAIFKQAQGDQDKLNALIASNLMPDSSYDGLAKNIIYMWYSGQWGPTVNNPNANLQQVRNISANAYVQGLMWSAAQTHPPGAKQPGYGSWAEKPIQD